MSEQAIVDRAMESYRLAHMIMEGKFGPAVAEAVPHLTTCAECWGQALRSKTRADVLIELGKLHQRLDDHVAAAAAYLDALETYRTLGERPSLAYAGVLAGLALKAQGRYEEALASVERSLAVEKDGGDLSHVARSLLILAGIHMDMGDHQRALERFDEAMPILERFGKAMELSQAHELIAVCWHALGRFDQSAAQFEMAIIGKRDLGNLKGAAKVISRFAELERVRGQLDSSLALHRRALEVHRLRNDQALIAHSLGNIGTIHADRGEFQAAHDQFVTCVQLLHAASENQAEALALTNLHLMQLKLGNEEGAVASLEQAMIICRSLNNRPLRERVIHAALELFRKRRMAQRELDTLCELRDLREHAGDIKGVASVLDELAVLYHGLKRYPEVRACLERRAAILEELGDQEGLLRALDDLTGIAVEQEDWNQAADHSERALAICRSRGIPAADFAARAYNLGLIHGKRSDHTSALDCYRQAAESWRESGNPEQAARSQRQMGMCELHMPGKSQDALVHYQEALAYYEGKADKRGIALALVGIGNAQANLGDAAAATAAFDRAASLKEELGDQRGTTMIRKATSALR